MDEEYRHIEPLSQCHYLPDQQWQLEYRLRPGLTQEAYGDLVRAGWRRSGTVLFRPICPNCNACQPIRIRVDDFKPDRSQRRVRKANTDTLLRIDQPQIDATRLELYLLHHRHHAEQKGWPLPTEAGAINHIEKSIEGSFSAQEWSYWVDEQLVAISYIDDVGDGFSGIYFYHHPQHRQRSLGNWICLSMIDEARRQGKRYVYLGYFIKNCRSMEYKGRFFPSEVLTDGHWVSFTP